MADERKKDIAKAIIKTAETSDDSAAVVSTADVKKQVNPSEKNEGKTTKKAASANAKKEPASKGKKTAAAVKTKNSATDKKTVNAQPVKKAEPVLDDVTTLLWNKLEKFDVSNIETPIAIQVIINNLGTFFIAIKEGGEKHIIQAVYDDRDGTLETSYTEILKMANGKYDYLKSINDGSINYMGDLRKAIAIMKLFN